MEVGYIIVLILGVFGLLSIFMRSFKDALVLVIILAGVVMTISGFIYGIYMTVKSDAFSYSIFDTFKFLKMYGKECLISRALFYGGIILAGVGICIWGSE